MGIVTLIGQDTKNNRKLDMQLLQSAYKNGVIANAKQVDFNNPKASINNPCIVDETSENIPEGLSWGIRELFHCGHGKFIIQITGVNTENVQKTWSCIGSKEGDTFTIGLWSPTTFDHPTGDGNQHVPANGTENGGKYLKATKTAGEYIWDNITSSDVINALGYAPSSESSAGIASIETTNSGNTITVIFTDGTKEIMEVVDEYHYTVKRYDNHGDLMSTTTTEIATNGTIHVETI